MCFNDQQLNIIVYWSFLFQNENVLLSLLRIKIKYMLSLLVVLVG